MKTNGLLIILAISMMGCARSAVDRHVIHSSELGAPSRSADATDRQVVEALSLDAMVGIWLRLDSEGELSKNRDSLEIRKHGSEYLGELICQGTSTNISLIQDHGAFYVVAANGTRYKMGRTESTMGKALNGIWLALDDIDLGNFQREDILKKLEGQ